MAQEKHFENKIKMFLKDSGCWFIKYWGGGEFTKSGIPDILCCCCGKFIGLEVKAPRGKATDLQKYNLKKIHRAGGIAVLLYPKDFCRFTHMIDLIVRDDDSWMDEYEYLKGVWSDE